MSQVARETLARELQGHGVEFGPGVNPLPVPPSVESVRYCDAYDRAGFLAEFPEQAGDIHRFPDPIHHRLHFDREPFVDLIGRGSLNFVVANHVLEHVVNPIRFLEQCFVVLAPGGSLLLGLPDKRWTFDRDRPRTSLAELIARYQAGENRLSDERIADYVNRVERPAEPLRPGDPARRDEFERHRRRSIHVNVWVIDDVIELFLHLGRQRGMPWELHDGAANDGEFLLLFRKSDTPEVLDKYPTTLSRLHAESVRRYLDYWLDDLTVNVEELCRFVRGIKKVGGAVPGGQTVRRWVKKG